MAKEISPILVAVARQRVARGVNWLNKRATYDKRFVGWRLRMMSIHNGHVSSHVRMQWNTNDPLSLACKQLPELADTTDGRVKWATTSKEFNFRNALGQKKAVYLGFNEGWQKSTHLSISDMMEYCSALNQAWSEALREHHTCEAPRLIPVREVRKTWSSLLPWSSSRAAS